MKTVQRYKSKYLSSVDLVKMLITITKQVPKNLSSHDRYFALKELVSEGKLSKWEYVNGAIKLFFNE